MVPKLQFFHEVEDGFFNSKDVSIVYSSCTGSPCGGGGVGDNDGKLEVNDKGTLKINRIMSDMNAITRSSDSENGSLTSGWSTDGPSTSADGSYDESLALRIKNLDDGRVFVIDEFSKDGSLITLREFGKDRTITFDEFERNFGPSKFVQRLMRREGIHPSSASKMSERRKRVRWLRRLGAVACIVDRQKDEINSNSRSSDSDRRGTSRFQRIKVRSYRKKSQEFSAVYKGQEIKAHKGAILTMKFSPEGQYLASGGEDGVVRVWRVIESHQADKIDLLKYDPSCIYFTTNPNSQLVPIYVYGKKKSTRRFSDSACVVIPTGVFWMNEKPLHEFHGHSGDVLDISWSKDLHLLSASMDKTARLWRVGCDSCLKVFSHTNYVTCIQFNPVNEDYFISGSIDGKVRVWKIPKGRVVDWIDIREIITAVCYHTDGKGAVVGTITGNCRFYKSSGRLLELEAQVSFRSKNKSYKSMITGFQFCSIDDRKLMVTSSDSHVRILDGVDVVCKYKGRPKAGSRISASFTTDSCRIVSASEDSNIYIWNRISPGSPTPNRSKSTRSCERFFSSNVTIAIPWNGPRPKMTESPFSVFFTYQHETGSSVRHPPFRQELSSEFLHKGTATWPVEKLPLSSAVVPNLCKTRFEIMQSGFSWGQVIVTAGSDGCISSFVNYGLPVHL